MPEFDAEDFYARFDDENLPIEIPDEVVDDIDNDFNLEIVDEEAAAEWVDYFIIIIMHIFYI